MTIQFPSHPWHWPQYVFASFLMLNFVATAFLHGRPKVDNKTGEPYKYSLPATTMGIGISVLLPCSGGFF